MVKRLRRASVDQGHVVKRLVDGKAGDLIEMPHLQHTVDHVGGVERLSFGGRGVRNEPQRSLGSHPERWRKRCELAGKQDLHDRDKVIAEQDFSSEAAIGQNRVVQMVSQAGEKDGRRVSGVVGGEDAAKHRYDQAVIAVVFRRFEYDPRLAGACGSCAWLADQGLGE